MICQALDATFAGGVCIFGVPLWHTRSGFLYKLSVPSWV